MTAEPRERGPRVRFPPPLVFLAAALAGVAVERLVVPTHLPLDRLPRILVGLAIVAAAATFLVSARVLFFRTGQNPVPWTPSPSLIGNGPYRFTRNPMYVGMTLLLVGIGVATDVLWIAAFAPLALACVHFIAVRPEEAYLTAKFGPAYDAYRARVRRYL